MPLLTTFKNIKFNRLQASQVGAFLLFILAWLLSNQASAQWMLINQGGGQPDSSAALEIRDTTRGFLLPRLSQTQISAIVNPASGLMLFNTDSNSFVFYNGSSWSSLKGSKLNDADEDTYIEVEANPDDDIVRIFTGGVEAARFRNGNLGLGVLNPGNAIHIDNGKNIRMNDFLAKSDSGIVFHDNLGELKSIVLPYDSNVVLRGDLSFGAPQGDHLGNHSITQNLIPNATNTFNLGSNTNTMNDLFWDGDVHVLNNIYIKAPINNSTFFGAQAGASATGASNTLIGRSAGTSISTGSSNTALGAFALDAATTGQNNTAIGANALGASNGFQNTAIGRDALFLATSGNDNHAFGYQSLYSLSSGSDNIAIGREALRVLTTTDDNVAVGREAGRYVQTGTNNVFLGNFAGRGTANHSKSGNVFIGYQAGYNETGSNLLYIENSLSSTPLIFGDFTADSVRIGGDFEANGNIHVNGDLKLHGEMHSDSTGAYNLAPIALGQVLANGTVQNGSSTTNFSVNKTGTGVYAITVNGYSLSINSNVVPVGSLIGGIGFIEFNSVSGDLIVYTYSTAGVAADQRFSFVLYSP